MKRNLKRVLSFFVCAMMVFTTIASVNAEENVNINGTYEIYVEGYDWGCATNKITLTLSSPLDNVTTDTFNVVEHSETFDYVNKTGIIPKEETRVVESVEINGNQVILNLGISPSVSSPIVWSLTTQYNTYAENYYFDITLNDKEATSEGLPVGEFVINQNYTNKTTAADNFEVDSYKANDGVNYDYAAYSPTTDSDTLVVWLHGLGEGGADADSISDRTTDPYVTLLANKATALAGDEFQNTIGGAHILVPQCPTYWMDNDGKQGNFNGAAIAADGTSYYQKSLHEFINYYKEQVGATKVVIAGCSNGGYMTLLMGMAYPDEYDAIVPICEAMPDKLITDEQLAGIKDLPMYFIWSNDDTTVVPEDHEIPTINRLKEMGASNLHVSTTDHVYDMSGLYTNDDGTPYQYDQGHWSWIYFYNNDTSCDECGETVFNFISEVVSVKDTVDESKPQVTEPENTTATTDQSKTAVKTGDNAPIYGYTAMTLLMAMGFVYLNKKKSA
ncbi:hypothetical protein [Thomasclavelia sp.]|uniref:carboxylesterase family protein n=1 Tax=Thomasclavelia sp. TaxID=3025757 RepID=UPI0025EE1447|nr:hypothetical protein [Thomasclavelia sp.]